MRWRWIALAALAAAVTGSCDRSLAQGRMDVMSFPHGGMVEGGGWQSAEWFSSMSDPTPWIELAPMSAVRLHHPLGRVPATVEIYLTVDRQPDVDGDVEDFGSGAFLAAGTVARIVDVNAMWVEIQNDSETPHRLRVVLR